MQNEKTLEQNIIDLLNRYKLNVITMNKLKELKEDGFKIVVLNGFRENLDYVLSLSNVIYTEMTIKSYDGYYEYYCFEN
jgi:hypothetical protein